jgi:hypothetical protein
MYHIVTFTTLIILAGLNHVNVMELHIVSAIIVRVVAPAYNSASFFLFLPALTS